MRYLLSAAVCAALGILTSSSARAATIQSYGEGSAVTSVDRSTTFDGLDYAHQGTPLSDYTAGSLSIRTNGNSYYGNNAAGWITTASAYLNPFHLTNGSPGTYSYAGVGGGYYLPYDGDWGNTDWITISTTDNKKIYAVEFLYGNAWTTGDIYGPYPWGNSSCYLQWETRVGNTVVSSDQLNYLGVGTVVGFYDPSGFDQLRVRCTSANSLNPGLLQELALDNLNVQITVPEPSTAAILFCVGLLGMLGRRGKY